MTSSLFRLAALAAVGGALALTELEQYGFRPPFTSFASDGAREVSPWWRKGGATEVMANFLRLTPDRQSKRGYLKGLKNLADDINDGLSITWRFRISGSGKKLFGDGMALWVDTSSSHLDGAAHGHTDKFTGFGIIVDTFVNTAPGHVHKDVLFITGDGTAPVLAPHGGPVDPKPTGCEADLRFFEGRGDFNVTARAALRVAFRDNKVSVYVDARNTGAWKECFRDAPVAAGPGWWKAGAYLGITASTGDLADNHDTISLVVTREDEPAPETTGLPAAAQPFTSSGNAEVDGAIQAAAAREASRVAEALTTHQHQTEHSLKALEDHVKVMLRKLSDSEAALERRIKDIEERLEKRVGEQLDATLNTRMGKVERLVQSAVNSTVTSLEGKLSSGGRAWMLPFLALCAVVGGLSVFAWGRYKKLMKSHLL